MDCLFLKHSLLSEAPCSWSDKYLAHGHNEMRSALTSQFCIVLHDLNDLNTYTDFTVLHSSSYFSFSHDPLTCSTQYVSISVTTFHTSYPISLVLSPPHQCTSHPISLVRRPPQQCTSLHIPYPFSHPSTTVHFTSHTPCTHRLPPQSRRADAFSADSNTLSPLSSHPHHHHHHVRCTLSQTTRI